MKYPQNQIYVWVYLNVKYDNMKDQIVFNLNRMYRQNDRKQGVAFRRLPPTRPARLSRSLSP